MAIVYAIQCPKYKDRRTGVLRDKFDLAPAHVFGDVVRLVPAFADPTDPRTVAILQRKLKKYTPDDFLLCIGSPILIGSATVYASRATGGLVRLLQWNRNTGEYDPVSLDLRK